MPDEHLRALNDFENILNSELFPADPPTPFELTMLRVRHNPDFVVEHEFWATDQTGFLLGTATAWYRDSEENRHALNVDVAVRPDHRRGGIGTALLRAVIAIAETHGRTTLLGTTRDEVPAGEIFARRVGATSALATTLQSLTLRDVDPRLINRWVTEGESHSERYRLVMVDGPYPDDLVEAVIQLRREVSTISLEPLSLEAPRLTETQVREAEASLAATETERWSIFALDIKDNTLAGFVEACWHAGEPQAVWLATIAVRPEHRQRSIAKWLEGTLIRRVSAERPQASEIRLSTMQSNQAMLSLCRTLGFKPMVSENVWRANLDRVRVYLQSRA